MFRNIRSTFRFYHTHVNKKLTVDPLEMENFNKLSKVWWDENGLLVPLHSFNRFRTMWIKERLLEESVARTEIDYSAPLKKLNVLDVGCGGGILTEALSRLGCNTTGLDANSELIEVAESHAKGQDLSNLQYVCETVQEHATHNKERYDGIVCSETIEHVTEKNEFVRYMVQCLKPGGSLFITTPNKTFISWFCIIIISENVLKIIPKGTHRYEMFIHRKDLVQMLNQEKCRTISTTGLFYEPWFHNWMVTKSENLSYALHAIKT